MDSVEVSQVYIWNGVTTGFSKESYCAEFHSSNPQSLTASQLLVSPAALCHSESCPSSQFFPYRQFLAHHHHIYLSEQIHFSLESICEFC